VLSNRRPAGLVSNYVPISEMRSWAGLMRIEGDDEIEFVELLVAMDDAFMRWHRDRDEREKATSASEGKPPATPTPKAKSREIPTRAKR